MPSIYQKLLAVQKAATSVPKRGYNSFHKYHYATEADILSIKEILNDNGLVVLPTTLHQETGFKPDGKTWASVTLLFRIVDTESGECVESQFTGYAEDNNDKAIYKATTGANKYFYLKFSGVATDDDPENENQVSNYTKTKNVASQASQRPPAQESRPVNDLDKQRCLKLAGQIGDLAQQKGLSKEELLKIAGIRSIKGLVKSGSVKSLEIAVERLQRAKGRAAL